MLNKIPNCSDTEECEKEFSKPCQILKEDYALIEAVSQKIIILICSTKESSKKEFYETLDRNQGFTQNREKKVQELKRLKKEIEQSDQPELTVVLPELKKTLLCETEKFRNILLINSCEISPSIAGMLASKAAIKELIGLIQAKLKTVKDKDEVTLYNYHQTWTKLFKIAIQLRSLPTAADGRWATVDSAVSNKQVIYLFGRFLKYLDQEYFI